MLQVKNDTIALSTALPYVLVKWAILEQASKDNLCNADWMSTAALFLQKQAL